MPATTGASERRDFGTSDPWDRTKFSSEVSEAWRLGLAYLTAGTETVVCGSFPLLANLIIPRSWTGTSINCVRHFQTRRSWQTTFLTYPEAAGALHRDSQPEARDRVIQLHDESGLTWGQIAKLFSVSRRAVHAWAAGGRMNTRNMELLALLLTAIQRIPAPDPEARRVHLMAPRGSSPSLFDELRQLGRTDDAVVEDVVPVRERLGAPSASEDR